MIADHDGLQRSSAQPTGAFSESISNVTVNFSFTLDATFPISFQVWNGPGVAGPANLNAAPAAAAPPSGQHRPAPVTRMMIRAT
jgi:hypothetical protein